jgi:hypothetical protein
MRAGGVIADYLAGIEATAGELAGSADDDLAAIGKRLAEAQVTLARTTDWLLTDGLADPTNSLAGASPYLAMCGVVTGAWLLARSALAARRLLDAGEGDPAFLTQKILTAGFYAEQILPRAAAQAPAVTAGAADLLAAAF